MTFRSVLNIALIAGGLAALAGCSMDQQQQMEPAPAPKTTTAAPAPKASTGNCASYMPAAGAGMNVSKAFFPSGDAASSAVLVNNVLPASVRLGQPYTYEIHVTNITSGTLSNVMVNNVNLSNAAIQSSVPPFTKAADGGYMWNLGDVASCKTTIIKVTAKADKVGVSSNCIGVTYNNALCAATNVVEPKIEIVKAITPESVLNCTPIEMSIDVKNPGTGVAENVVVKDNLPAGLTTTDGKQMVQALLLSEAAEFDSKPELEIYADDVVCGHGSTSAEIDEDLLFYCRSRGIPPGEARAMLVESFIGEAIAKVGHEGLNEALMAKARAWLAAASGS